MDSLIPSMPTYWAKAYSGDLAQHVSIEGIKLFDPMPRVAMVAWENGRAYGSGVPGVRQGVEICSQIFILGPGPSSGGRQWACALPAERCIDREHSLQTSQCWLTYATRAVAAASNCCLSLPLSLQASLCNVAIMETLYGGIAGFALDQ